MSEIDLMIHAIGLNYEKPYTRHGKKFYKPCRNYFNTCLPDKEWEEITNKGYATMSSIRESKSQDGTTIYKTVNFYLTRKGLDYLGEFLNITIYDKEM